jgi:catechol 2,3-dioxygenase
MSALPEDARIGDVSLVVSDLDRSVEFYGETLGFRVLSREGSRAALGAGQHGPLLLRLVEHPRARRRPSRTAGLYHVAVLVPDRAALGRSLRRLAQRKWPLTGAADHLVSEAVYLDDPDGLGIEIYRDRPRADWRRRASEILMATEPLDLDDVIGEPGAGHAWAGLAPETAIGHVHLHVPSLEAAEAFYCQEIGFRPTLRSYPGALFVAAGDYHHHVGLNIWAGRGAPPPPADAVGLRSFSIVARGLDAREHQDIATGTTVVRAATS